MTGRMMRFGIYRNSDNRLIMIVGVYNWTKKIPKEFAKNATDYHLKAWRKGGNRRDNNYGRLR